MRTARMTPTILSLVRVVRSHKSAMKPRSQINRVSAWRLEEKSRWTVNGWLRVKSGVWGPGLLGEIRT
jgi:hypothetical protein